MKILQALYFNKQIKNSTEVGEEMLACWMQTAKKTAAQQYWILMSAEVGCWI